MADIKNIAIHHSGGLGTNAYASTAHLSAAGISEAHRQRWDFPSQYMKDPAGKPWYFGYSVIYDPKNRTFFQGRALGEETAAQYGFNFDTFSICIIGNFMRKPLTSVSVDPLTKQIEEDITLFLFDLINGNRRGLKVVPGTTVSLAIARVSPHRFYQPTECYGSFVKDSHFRDLLVAYKPAPILPAPTTDISTSTVQLEKRGALAALIMQVILALADFLAQLRETPGVGAHGGRACDGTI